MKPLYRQRTVMDIHLPDPNPVFCDLVVLIMIYNAQPFSFMNSPKDITENCVHIYDHAFLLI